MEHPIHTHYEVFVESPHSDSDVVTCATLEEAQKVAEEWAKKFDNVTPPALEFFQPEIIIIKITEQIVSATPLVKKVKEA